MLNRKIAPLVHPISNLSLPVPEIFHLANGIPVYVLNYPKTDILKLEIVYRAGRPEEQKRLVSRATARLLRDGSKNFTAADIAEHIDFYGGTFANPTNIDTSNFVLFAQKKYFQHIFPVLAEALQDPIFPENELQNFVRTGIADLQIDLEKPEVVAYRKITELIFGADHPYGYNSEAFDYQSLTTKDLQLFFQTWYTPNNCKIFISGNIRETEIKLLDKFYGSTDPSTSPKHLIPPQSSSQPSKHYFEQKGSLQKAIKIGRRLFNKQHPDFMGMFILNTILGGYFGSRLMTNIREKKGYTYNIYSMLDAMLHEGCLYIATEVNENTAAKTIREIYKELKKLREVPIAEDELRMVKNYLLGTMLTNLDGLMNTSEVVRGLVTEGLPFDTFEKMCTEIHDITAAGLQRLANQYFQKQDFWEVIVG